MMPLPQSGSIGNRVVVDKFAVALAEATGCDRCFGGHETQPDDITEAAALLVLELPISEVASIGFVRGGEGKGDVNEGVRSQLVRDATSSKLNWVGLPSR